MTDVLYGAMDDADRPQLWHTCEDGHNWREQPDGGVSPSWGCALTSVHYDDWNPRRCPEPHRDGDGRIECAGCGEHFYIGHGTPGVMCDPWNYDERCLPAPPECGKPPARTRAWLKAPGEKYGGWVDLDDPNDVVLPGTQLELAIA